MFNISSLKMILPDSRCPFCMWTMFILTRNDIYILHATNIKLLGIANILYIKSPMIIMVFFLYCFLKLNRFNFFSAKRNFLHLCVFVKLLLLKFSSICLILFLRKQRHLLASRLSSAYQLMKLICMRLFNKHALIIHKRLRSNLFEQLKYNNNRRVEKKRNKNKKMENEIFECVEWSRREISFARGKKFSHAKCIHYESIHGTFYQADVAFELCFL